MDYRKEMLALLPLDDAHSRTSQNEAPGAPKTTLPDENAKTPSAVPKRQYKGRKSLSPRSLSPLIDLHHDSLVESDASGSENSLFSTQYTSKAIRSPRKRNLATSPKRLLKKVPSRRCSDSSPESVTKYNLKKLFERRQKRRKLREKACEAKEICSKHQKQLQQFCKYIPTTKHHRRWKDETGLFPFLDQKDLTLNMIFTYEQASLWGFLHHMERLKYDRHLQESLRNLNVSDVSDDGDLVGRGHNYLDDDGPLSPISDVDCCNATEPLAEYDAKVVINPVASDCRDVEALKKRWQDARIKIRRKVADHKRATTAIGGGSPQALRLRHWEEEALKLLQLETLSGVGDAELGATSGSDEG